MRTSVIEKAKAVEDSLRRPHPTYLQRAPFEHGISERDLASYFDEEECQLIREVWRDFHE